MLADLVIASIIFYTFRYNHMLNAFTFGGYLKLILYTIFLHIITLSIYLGGFNLFLKNAC